MVHALRQEVGDAAFFAGLRTYFQRHGGGTASDAAFQVIMEEAAGYSLDAFFAEVVELTYQTGHGRGLFSFGFRMRCRMVAFQPSGDVGR